MEAEDAPVAEPSLEGPFKTKLMKSSIAKTRKIAILTPSHGKVASFADSKSVWKVECSLDLCSMKKSVK